MQVDAGRHAGGWLGGWAGKQAGGRAGKRVGRWADGDAITELRERVATSHTLHIRRSHTLPVVIRSMFILKSSFIKTPLIKLPSVGQDVSLTLLAENPLI